MEYYDFRKNWQEIFVPLLQDERIERVINYVEHEILCAIDTEYYAYDENFRDQILSLTKEQGISLIHSKCWGKFSTVLDKSDEEEMEYYSKISKNEFDDPKILDHYFLTHNCEKVVLLIWSLCSLAWPEDTWILCYGIGHWWVQKQGNSNIIYDFLWNYVYNEEVEVFNCEYKKFYHPYQCISMYYSFPVYRQEDVIYDYYRLLGAEESWEVECSIRAKKALNWAPISREVYLFEMINNFEKEIGVLFERSNITTDISCIQELTDIENENNKTMGLIPLYLYANLNFGLYKEKIFIILMAIVTELFNFFETEFDFYIFVMKLIRQYRSVESYSTFYRMWNLKDIYLERLKNDLSIFIKSLNLLLWGDDFRIFYKYSLLTLQELIMLCENSKSFKKIKSKLELCLEYDLLTITDDEKAVLIEYMES